MIYITGLPKAAVLAALFNASKKQGTSTLLDNNGDFDISVRTGEDIIGVRLAGAALHYDSLRGRVLNVNLTNDEFAEWGYDEANGEGAAARAIDAIRADYPAPVVVLETADAQSV